MLTRLPTSNYFISKQMKKLILLYSLFIGIVANAQVTLTGTVKDLANQGLPGAVIYFPDLKSGAVSQADGSFTINNLPKIKTLLQVRLLGYKTFVKTIDLATQTTLSVLLEESVVEENEVVVTGVSKATEVKRSAVPMVFIDQKYIQQNTATNAIDVLARVPGVSTLSTGPNVSKPYIRGLGYNRVLTLFDGVRMEGQQWGDEHGIEVDQYLIDRIEVVKGPASLIYGSDALAGVVNLLPENPLSDGVVKGDLQANYQTNNGLVASSLSFAGNTKGFIWGIRGSYKAASNFQNKYDGRVYNTGFNEKDAYAYVGLNRKWGYSHLTLSMFDNLQEIPDGSRDSLTRRFTKQITEDDTLRPIVSDDELRSYKIGVIHQRVQHYRVFSTSNIILGQSKLAVRLGYQQSIRREYGHPQAADIAALYLLLNTVSYDVKYYLPEKNGWETTTGINGMYQTNNTDKATEFVIPNFNLFDFGPFIYAKKTVGKFDFAAGARYDIRHFNNGALYTITDTTTGFDKVVSHDVSGATQQFSSYSHTFQGFSGSAGLTYNISSRFLIKANIARGYRAPNISEISAKGVHPGTGFQQLGNPDFKPEFNLQEDIGVFFDSEHISASGEAFHNIISNYIFNQKLQSVSGGDSLFVQDGNSYPVYKFRQTRARLFGGEVRIDIHPHPLDWLHFENSVSMVYALNLGGNGAVIDATNKYLPFIPPLHTNSELRAEVKNKIACFNHLYVKVGVQYYAAQNRILSADNTETVTPGYTLLDAGLGADIENKKGKVLFNFGLFGTNLANTAYQSNMSRLKYFDNYPNNATGRSGIYSMGRNISLKIRIPLDIQAKRN